MRRFQVFVAGIASTLLGASLAGVAQSPPSFETALAEFWAADSAADAARAAERIVASTTSFDDVYARLNAGRAYSSDARRGTQSWRSMGPGGIPLTTSVVVPADYNPAKRYSVRVYLHGGVTRDAPPDALRAARRRLECALPCIAVYPTGMADAPWWSAAQVENLERLLVRLKRTYNVDENRVHLMGVSDGGTGVYFFGMRDATLWSSLFPFNGHLGVLANETVGADGDMYPSNLSNSALYVVNGGQDPMYPVRIVEPYLALLRRVDVQLTFHPQPTAGHDTSWWPAEEKLVDEFEQAHPRDPLPDRLSWQTERTDRYNRFRWLIVETLDATRSESPLSDENTLASPGGSSPAEEQAFPRRTASGRVDLERSGNVVHARTRGVGRFTLLISPTEFRFDEPVKVVVNGQTAFDGRVTKELPVLLKWAARDVDRSLLFGAELHIDVPRPSSPAE